LYLHRQDNEKTRQFYEKNKYKLVNEFPDYYGFPTGTRTVALYTKKV